MTAKKTPTSGFLDNVQSTITIPTDVYYALLAQGGSQLPGSSVSGVSATSYSVPEGDPYNISENTTEEEYYNAKYKDYEDQYNKTAEQAAITRDASIVTAQKAYQELAAENEAAYQMSQASAGRKGEELKRMGLNGSGQSDYLTGKANELRRSGNQAAAVMRSEQINAANNLYEQKLLNAEAAKNQGMSQTLDRQFAAYKQNNLDRMSLIAGILDLAQAGNTNIDTLKMLARERGFELGDESWGVIESEINHAKTDIERQFILALFNGQQPIIDNFDPKKTEDVRKIKLIAKAYGVDLNGELWKSVAASLGITE